MSNIDNMSDISIEQFAAFLDGNLSEADMQTVSDAIDGNQVYSDIIGDVMNVDDYAESLDANGMAEMSDVLGEDFVLPEIPSVGNDIDTVNVISVEPDDSNVVAILDPPYSPGAEPVLMQGDESGHLEDIPTLKYPDDTEVTLQEPTDSTTDIDLNDLA